MTKISYCKIKTAVRNVMKSRFHFRPLGNKTFRMYIGPIISSCLIRLFSAGTSDCFWYQAVEGDVKKNRRYCFAMPMYILKIGWGRNCHITECKFKCGPVVLHCTELLNTQRNVFKILDVEINLQGITTKVSTQPWCWPSYLTSTCKNEKL